MSSMLPPQAAACCWHHVYKITINLKKIALKIGSIAIVVKKFARGRLDQSTRRPIPLFRIILVLLDFPDLPQMPVDMTKNIQIRLVNILNACIAIVEP